jgi:hypothetical protein
VLTTHPGHRLTINQGKRQLDCQVLINHALLRPSINQGRNRLGWNCRGSCWQRNWSWRARQQSINCRIKAYLDEKCGSDGD